MGQSPWPLSLSVPRHPEGMHPQAAPHHLQKGRSVPWPPPPPYAPVGVGGWHLPGLDAFQGTLAPHHHAQVGIPVGVVTLGLCGAVGPTGPARGEQPVNCGTRGKIITHLAWPSLLQRLPKAAYELSAPWPCSNMAPRPGQETPIRHLNWKSLLRIYSVPGPGQI